ncbi:NUDIX domain-containing protein [Spongorhabdus nitratireducens]
MVYDQHQGLWRLPGGVLQPADQFHVNTAAREVLEELKISLNLEDLTNLNRSYTYDDHTVYITGDETCRGLFFLSPDQIHEPNPQYRFPKLFDPNQLEQQVKEAQSLLPVDASSQALHEVTQVSLIDIRTLRNWFNFNDINDHSRFPVGKPITIVDVLDPSLEHKLEYRLLWVLSRAMMVECQTCTALNMFDVMINVEARSSCDMVLASILGLTPTEIRKAPFSSPGVSCMPPREYSLGADSIALERSIETSAVYNDSCSNTSSVNSFIGQCISSELSQPDVSVIGAMVDSVPPVHVVPVSTPAEVQPPVVIQPLECIAQHREVLIPDITTTSSENIATLVDIVKGETAWNEYQGATANAHLMFNGINPCDISATAFTKNYFKHKVRLYLALMQKYPQQFSPEQFAVYVAAIDNKLATDFACKVKTLDQVLPELQALGFGTPAVQPIMLSDLQHELPAPAPVAQADTNNIGDFVRAYDDNLRPSAMSYLYRFDEVIRTEQGRYHSDKYYLQVMRSGGNCLYLAYLSGWLHALVADVVTGRNPQAIQDEIETLLTGRTDFREFMATPDVFTVGLHDTTDDLVGFLLELNDDPTIAHLHQMIMPDQWVMMRTPGGEVPAWGGKEQRLEALAQYFRTYAVFLKRQSMLEERLDDACRTAEAFPTLYHCQQEVFEFSICHHNLNPIDAFLLYQAQPGVWATDLEMQMLNSIRPISLCFESSHPQWDHHCDDTQGFKPGVFAEGQRIVILQRRDHYEALIPADLFAQ